MFVVFDSNVWFSQQGLNSEKAKEGLEFIRSRDGTLVIPEVVRLEVEAKLCEELLKRRKDIKDSHRYIANIVTDIEDLRLPTYEDIKERIRSLTKETGVKTREMSLTLEATKSSWYKILHKLQPSDRKEQFADGVIWANCLELLQESDVYLVSEDKAFYKDCQYNHGLAPNLLKEAANMSNKLRLFSDLESLLRVAKQDVQRVWPDNEPEQVQN